jgi:hypothetical protein
VLGAREAEGHALVDALDLRRALLVLAIGEVAHDVVPEEHEVLVAAFGHGVHRAQALARALRHEGRAARQERERCEITAI